MIPRDTLRLVMLVSCAHSMVHIYEFSLPSVEQMVADDFGVGKETTGWLIWAWRLPFGFGAFAAGWLVDRFGSRRMLAVYLLVCAATAAVAGCQVGLSWLFPIMFLMGLAASIYHPAGLALISHETTASNRPRALGVHGIFGSMGIGSAPFLAGAVLNLTPDWRHYFTVLAVPGLALGLFFLAKSMQQGRAIGRLNVTYDAADDEVDWSAYFGLLIFAMMMGFTYSAVLSFLPRYVDGAGISIRAVTRESLRNYLSGGVLFVGCLGQFIAGRLARQGKLEQQLAWISFVSVPILFGMAVAEGRLRLVITALFSFVHFMHQPIYNSLVATYTSRKRRSLAYGFSFGERHGDWKSGRAVCGIQPK